MTDYQLIWEDNGVTRYWSYASKGINQWAESPIQARLYARRQSAETAKVRILAKDKSKAGFLKVAEA